MADKPKYRGALARMVALRAGDEAQAPLSDEEIARHGDEQAELRKSQGIRSWSEVMASLDAPEQGARTVPQPSPSVAAGWEKAIAIANGKVMK